MLGYLAIFSVSLCGYGSMPIWTVGAGTIALAILALAEHHALYRRGVGLGLVNQADMTLGRSFVNAFSAAAVAYAFGVLVRLVSAA